MAIFVHAQYLAEQNGLKHRVIAKILRVVRDWVLNFKLEVDMWLFLHSRKLTKNGCKKVA